MKTTLYSTASVAALLVSAGTALADDTFTGVAQFSIGGGTAELDLINVVDDPFIYGGKAKGLWSLTPEFQVQVDLFAQQRDDVIKFVSDNDATLFGGTAHLIYVFENRARFGLAGSVWEDDVFSVTSGGDQDATYGLAALEGQFFGTDWTGIGQAGVFTNFDCGSSSSSCLVLENGTFIRGKLRYFLTDNTALTAEMHRMWGNFDDSLFGGKSITVEQEQWGLEAEHRFAGSQFAAFATLSHESSEALLFSLESTTASIGVKFYWNQASLRSNDRSGAEFDTPTFGHAIGLGP
jgi:hypothetical protein